MYSPRYVPPRYVSTDLGIIITEISEEFQANFSLKYTKSPYTVFSKNFLETVFSQKPTSKAYNARLVYERALMGEILNTENHCFLKQLRSK